MLPTTAGSTLAAQRFNAAVLLEPMTVDRDGDSLEAELAFGHEIGACRS
jgi:hypothetical protein